MVNSTTCVIVSLGLAVVAYEVLSSDIAWMGGLEASFPDRGVSSIREAFRIYVCRSGKLLIIDIPMPCVW